MNAEYRKKAYCLTCKKLLEDEYVPSHRDLHHLVDFYVYGGYRRTENEVKNDSGNEDKKPG